MNNETGLVIIGHGSKLPKSREDLEKIAEILRKRSKFKAVEISFMVRNSPTIPEAIDTIATKGVKKIVLIPAFLSQGVHTTQEIPQLIGMKEKKSQLTAKGIKLIYGEPLGSDERIADIIEEKAVGAIDKNYTTGQENDSDKTLKAAQEIFEKSMKLIRKEIQEVIENTSKKNATVIERVVHTTADPEFSKSLVISKNAVDAGIKAIQNGSKIVTDVKMVKAGINEKRLRKFGIKCYNYVDDKRAYQIASEKETTRSVAAMQLAINDDVNNAIILIGNAPTAAFELVKAVKEGKAKPALIVATPVGYVGAKESKEAVSMLEVPFIIIKGKKGGSAIAVAIFNSLLNMAENSINGN